MSSAAFEDRGERREMLEEGCLSLKIELPIISNSLSLPLLLNIYRTSSDLLFHIGFLRVSPVNHCLTISLAQRAP